MNGKFIKIGLLSLAIFYAYFNRNPIRVIEVGVTSPADGTIEKIENNKIDIFIGITDVHIQRAPITGSVISIQDYPNENKNIIIISNLISTYIIERKGELIARSVLTSVQIGDNVTKGQIIGKIMLGSHTSIYPIINPIVNVGDHIIAGQTLQN